MSSAAVVIGALRVKIDSHSVYLAPNHEDYYSVYPLFPSFRTKPEIAAGPE